MRAENELFKDKIEVSLDGRQVFYLFFGGAVIASLVFVLGVMVGKRVEARAHMDGRPATSATHDPLAALDQLSRHDELAFPAALAGLGNAPLGRVDAILAGRMAAEADEDDAPPVADEGDEPASGDASNAESGQDEAVGDKTSTGGSPAAKPAKPAKARPAGVFTLQLSSFRDRAEADAFHKKLTEAGYGPYIAEANVPDKGVWYRVRLGQYESYDAALGAKKDFEADQHIIAYVTRLRN